MPLYRLMPASKACRCGICNKQLFRGEEIAHFDSFGHIGVICLPCMVEMGKEASERLVDIERTKIRNNWRM